MEDQTPIPEGSLPRAGQVYQNEHEIYLNVGRGGSYRLARFQDVQYKTVETIAERNAIDEIFRTEGMLVWVNDSLEHYMLVGGLENANWTPYLSGTYATITGSNINLAAFRTALNVNLTDNTSDLNKPVSTATQTALDLKQNLSAKNQANGYAGLDSGALLPLSLFPDSVLGNLKYGGTYNGTVISASDDFPELNGQNLPTSGYVGVYFIATAQFTRASVTYDVGDWIIHNGSNNYVKVDNSDAVTTVFGRLGNVVANEADYSAFYLPITNPTFTGTITGGNSVLSGSATVGTYIYGASSKRLAYTAGANLNILYSGGSGGLTINNQADNLALLNVSDAGVLTVHPLAGSGERSLVATSTGAIAISAAPFITAAQTYYIGTTQNALNRTSGAQTLTGISIDGSAATLTNTRTIWGQNFNGSANVSGALTGVTDITASGSGTFGSSITIPTNSGYWLSGNTNWGMYYNGTTLNFRPNGNDGLAMSLNSSGGLTAASFTGAGTGLTGTASGLSIGGNSATTTLWGNRTADFDLTPLSSGITFMPAFGGTGAHVKAATVAGVKDFLGLGTNAYTSTAYLPLTAGSSNKLSAPLYFTPSSGFSAIGVNGTSMEFYNGAGSETRYTIDASGNNTWTNKGKFGGAIITSGALDAVSANTGFLDFVGGKTRLATVGANTGSYGTFSLSQYSSDGSLGRDFYNVDVNGNNTWTGSGTFGGALEAASSFTSPNIFFKGDGASGTYKSRWVDIDASTVRIDGYNGTNFNRKLLLKFDSGIELESALTGTSATFSSSLNTIGGGVYSKNADDSYIGFDKFFTNRGRITSYNDTTATWNDISINEGGGRVLIGTDTSNGVDKLQVNGSISASSDVEITDTTKGIILKSPDSTRYRITVANGGTLTVTAI